MILARLEAVHGGLNFVVLPDGIIGCPIQPLLAKSHTGAAASSRLSFLRFSL